MSIDPNELGRLPWRAQGAAIAEVSDRPRLPLPPVTGSELRMPFRDGGSFRKRWRYVGAYDSSFMLGISSVAVGPALAEFWWVWDRIERRMHEGTRRLFPGRGRRVVMSQEPGTHRVELRVGGLEVDLEVGDGAWIESICPSGSGSFIWTRKLAATPARGRVVIEGRESSLEGMGLIDDSAGYHPRRTFWHWSSGVGIAKDGRRVGWNLVTGVNDPPENSERTIWVEGEPAEPGIVTFSGTESIGFAEGGSLTCHPEGVRVHDEGVPLLISSEYRAPFGTFTGQLPGGIELEWGLGVMEEHDALW